MQDTAHQGMETMSGRIVSILQILCTATLLMAGTAALAWAQDGTASSPSAQAHSAASQGESQDGQQAEGTAAKATVAATEDDAEDDIEWLTDELGKYRVVKITKGVEGRNYMWIGEDRVQMHRGLRYQVVKHDDEYLWIKSYDNTYKPQEPKVDVVSETEIEEQEAIRVSYLTDLDEVDRLALVPFDAGLPRRGQWRNGFDVADMNGDGELDIVFGPARKSTRRPNIFLGDGQGNWATWRARYPNKPYSYGTAAVADFNGDGHPDIAFGMHLRGILVLVGDSAGNYKPWSEGIGLETPGQGGDASTFSSVALAPVDWDGDGDIDLLALGEGPKGIRILMEEGGELKNANGPILFVNHNDGTWEPRGQASKVFGNSLALGDFNQDGRVDFATANNSQNHELLNLGGQGTQWETKTLEEMRQGAFPFAVHASDLNGDGLDDLLVGFMSHDLDAWRSGVDVFLATDKGTWLRRPLYLGEGNFGVYAIATGDLDGDGRKDVGVADGLGQIKLFLGDAAGFFDQEVAPADELPAPIPGCKGYAIRLVDLNGDGLDEVVAAFAGESTGLPGILDKPGCPGGGSLRVWSPRLRSAAEPSVEGNSTNR